MAAGKGREESGPWPRAARVFGVVGKQDGRSGAPSNENRITKISEWLPQALEKRAESDCRGTAAFADRFREAIRRRSATVVV